MRVVILSLFATVLLLTPVQGVAAMTLPSNASPVAASYQDPGQPAKDFRVDINVNHSDRAWYYSPMWIAIGAVVLILFVALIVMASRGGGTTIVKE